MATKGSGHYFWISARGDLQGHVTVLHIERNLSLPRFVESFHACPTTVYSMARIPAMNSRADQTEDKYHTKYGFPFPTMWLGSQSSRWAREDSTVWHTVINNTNCYSIVGWTMPYQHGYRGWTMLLNEQCCWTNNVPEDAGSIPSRRTWSYIFRNWSRFGSYNVYLNDTRISYTQLWLSSIDNECKWQILLYIYIYMYVCIIVAQPCWQVVTVLMVEQWLVQHARLLWP